MQNLFVVADVEDKVEDKSNDPFIGLDIMAQQLKFVACLKILMEELSTLATGYEVDGGELRYHLYLWLEREVDALRHLCNYSYGDIDSMGKIDPLPPLKKNSASSVTEVILCASQQTN